MQRRPVRCKFLGAGDFRCASMGCYSESPIRPPARAAASAPASCFSQSLHPCTGVLAEVGVSVNDQGDFQCDFVQCGGRYDAARRGHDDNVVVFADPV